MPAYRFANIVVLGAFNPAIFQPEWFRTHELLPDIEIDAATKQGRILVSSDATALQFESLGVDVMTGRASFHTSREDWFEDLAPLVASVFGVLEQCPITRLGANFVAHWPKERATATDVVRRWLPLTPLAEVVGEPKRVGASVLAEWNGYQVTVGLEPSLQLRDGVYLTHNFDKKITGVAQLRKTLADDWKALIARANETTERILGHGRPDDSDAK